MKEFSSKSHEVAAAFGKAYNFDQEKYPVHMYQALDEIANRFYRGQIRGGIAVCGNGEMKALAAGKVAPTAESAEMRRYLVEAHGIPPEFVYEDDRSTNTPENLLELRAMAEEFDWQSIDIFTAAPRAERINFLAQKICYGQFEVGVVKIPTDEELPDEQKLLGDMVCTLKDMQWGDAAYLLDPNTGASRWDELRLAHHDCEYYIPGAEAEPYVNYHPVELMQSFGVPPEY